MTITVCSLRYADSYNNNVTVMTVMLDLYLFPKKEKYKLQIFKFYN